MPTATLPKRRGNAAEADGQQTTNVAEVAEPTFGRRWKRGKYGRPVPKADTGNLDAVHTEMTRAFRHSPDVIAKVGNSLKEAAENSLSGGDVPQTIGGDTEAEGRDERKEEMGQEF